VGEAERGAELEDVNDNIPFEVCIREMCRICMYDEIRLVVYVHLLVF